MSSLTLAELEQETRELIGVMAFDRVFAPAGSMDWCDEAINWACDMATKLLGLTRTTVMLSVSSKKVTIPTDAIKVVDVVSGSSGMGKLLFESTMKIEDQKNINWKSNTTAANAWIQQDGSTILLNGVVSTGNVLVGYIQIPTAMSSSTDTPDSRIPIEFHQYLKYAAATYLLTLATQMKNVEQATKHFASFSAGLGLGDVPLASVSVMR